MLSSGISQVVYGLEVVQLSELFGGVEGLLTGGYLLHFRCEQNFKDYGGKIPLARRSMLQWHCSTAASFVPCEQPYDTLFSICLAEVRLVFTEVEEIGQSVLRSGREKQEV